MEPTVEQPTVFDDELQQAGTVYAQALLGAAEQAGCVEAVVEQLQGVIREGFDRFPTLELALAAPRLSESEKVAMLDRIFGDRVEPLLLNFLKVLARRRRLPALRSILAAMLHQRDEQLGRVEVEVTTAAPLSEQQLGQVQERLETLFAGAVRMQLKVDPQLIGGLVIRIGDRVYDGSLDGQLERLQETTRLGAMRGLRQRRGVVVAEGST
jgi:F-type H+-transporting ATPase subunit delta